MTEGKPTVATMDEAPLVSTLNFPVVGIGASAGGVAALQALFSAMPGDSGMAFVVVLHLSPRHASTLPEIIRQVTAMPVVVPEDEVPLEANHVYVLGPNKLFAMSAGMLSVTPLNRPRGRQVTIDLFFRTLAVVHRERAMAVVLSGSGADGSVGITRVREEGGVTLAQSPLEAEFDSMPRAAIASGTIDWVLPVAEMPHKLAATWANAQQIELPHPAETGLRVDEPPSAKASEDAEVALRDILLLLRNRTGHDFRNYKRATVLRRLERRMQVNGVPNLPAYLACMEAQPEEPAALLKDLLIGVTNFFRDAGAFDVLQREVVPRLFESGSATSAGVRAWIPGCASGEEAYSMSILLSEHAATLAQPPKISVFATDIDEAAIAVARLGCYSTAIETDVSASRLQRFFDKDGVQYRIRKEVRERVMFATHNILRDPPFSRLDFISCRNLLIYLDRDVHAEILEMFHFALKPGGLLFLGSSESAETPNQLFSIVDKKNRIFRSNPGVTTHHLVNLVQPELRVELRTAIFQAMRSGKSVEAQRVYVEDGADRRCVTMIVRPVHEPELNGQYALVLFDQVESSMGVAAPADRDPMVLELEAELGRTKEQLQGTIEHSETSTEELKASNEELQAINEELRSTSEELETSKEELQSINEELITVNHELKTKIDETGKINDDLQNLIAANDIATVFVDRGMNIKRYTPRASRIFNLIASDIGRSLLDITHKLQYERLAADAQEAFQLLRLIEREVRSDDGTWYLARVLPYRTTEDRIEGAILSFVDITSRRLAEENIRLIAESTKDFAILTCDAEGLITTWNLGAERVFGWLAVEAIGQPMGMLFTDEDRQAGVPEQERQEARTLGRAEDERWHQRKDGSRFYSSGITTPLYERGQLVGYGKIARNLTGSKQVEAKRDEQLQRSAVREAEAQAASDLKDEFLAMMSHELKNPLNLIQLNVDLLLRMPEVAALSKVSRAAQTMSRAVSSQARIIDDLLDLSRVNTGKLLLSPTPVDWVTTIRQITEAMAGEAKDKGIELSLHLPGSPLVVDADPIRLEQIVWNLLSNAFKFTPPKAAIAVTVNSDARTATLEVRDSGIGISASTLPHVFDMYRQAEQGSTRRHGGLGIGLALVRSLVLAHGGKVEVTSPGAGGGSTFTVTLPLAGEKALQPLPSGIPMPRQLAGRRVLVVDDDAQAVETLQELLRIEGAEVLTARGARQALVTAEQEALDYIVTDIAMPEMDGYTFLDRLRKLSAHRSVPVIALTAWDGRAMRGASSTPDFPHTFASR